LPNGVGLIDRAYTEQIKQELEQNGKILLQGEHGIGKTALAILYANKNLNNYDNIIYFSCATSMLSSLEANFAIRDFVGDGNASGEEFFGLFIQKLASLNGDKNLLLIDDVPDAEEFAKYMRYLPSDGWEWLLTSNTQLNDIKTLNPELLTLQEAKELFKKIKSIGDDEESGLDELLEKLGLHALSVELTARVAKGAEVDINELLKAIDKYGIALTASIDNDVIAGIERGAGSAPLIRHIEHILFDIKRPTKILDNSTNTQLLIYIAFLPKSFTTDDLTQWLSFMSLEAREIKQALKLMQNYGFISAKQKDSWYCHASIKAGVIARLQPRYEFLASLLERITVLSNNDSQNSDYKKWLYNSESIEEIAQSIERQGEKYGQNESALFANLLNNLGLAYKSKGEYDKAISYHEKALEINLITTGENNPDTASIYNNLGSAYNSKGKYDKAIDYYKKALEIVLKTIGENNPITATPYNNIGLAYHSKKEYDKAIDYYKKALEINLKTIGENNPNTATHCNNLGGAYNSKGDYDKAIEYYKKALEINLKTLGENHPNTATHCNNLGGAYNSKGEYDKAIGYHEKALEIDLKTIGENNPNTARDYNNLGMAYDSKGEYDKAIDYHKKAYVIAEKMLGKNHPTTIVLENNLKAVEQRRR